MPPSALETDGSAGIDAEAPLQASVPLFAARGLEPPAVPSKYFIFKLVMKKHLFLAVKRKRPLASLFPVLLWSILAAVLLHAFESGLGDNHQIRVLLEVILMPLYLTLLISQSMQSAIADIVSDKESKMKVIQDVYGLPTSIYWLTWYTYYGIVSVGCIFIVYVVLVFINPVFTSVNQLIFIFFWLAAFAQQFLFICVASALFDTVRTATMFVSFLGLLMMGSASALQGLLRGKSDLLWWLASFLPQVNTFNMLSAMFFHKNSYICTGSSIHDEHCTQPGLTFGNVFQNYVCTAPYTVNATIPADDPYPCPDVVTVLFPAGYSLIMMVVNIAIFVLLAWWLENVRQGEYGSAKPLCFCLDAAFMCPRRQVTPLGQQPAGSTVAMSIRQLTKVFNGKVAVDNLSLDMHGHEIFALLGHNGAGKTTAINCIVGLISPTSGGAIVNGCDIRTDIEGARRQLSICPQDNPMYKEFTVRQHLVFFACLRGVSESRVNDRIIEVLSALGMPEKVDSLCSTLSGGQKRRLWVATALLGDSPISFLDEPTSGMDPSSRRELWDLLLDMKAQGRCVIFTTHYLEEADVLADRKAVMARGRIMAVGTSRELKTQFGLGYHLAVELTPGASDEKIGRLRSFITNRISSAQEEHLADEEHMQAGDASVFYRATLPYDEVPNFGPLLEELESKKADLGAHDYTLAMTSLEEVFMSLGRQADDAAGGGDNVDFREVEAEGAVVDHRAETSPIRSLLAMARVRMKAISGDRRSMYVTFVMPALFVVLSVLLSSGSSSDSNAGNAWSLALYPPMAFGLASLQFTLTVVMDKDPTSKVKHTVLAQGVTPLAYWGGTALAHYVASLPVLVVFIAMIWLKSSPSLTGAPFPMLLVMTILYPAELLVYAYNLALLFSSIETAAKYVSLFSLFFGTVPVGLEFAFLSLGWQDAALWLHYAFCVLNPVYGLPGMIVFLSLGPDSVGISTLGDALTSQAAMPLYLLPVCVLIWVANLVWRESRSYASPPGEFVHFDGAKKDEDVIAEENRIRSAPVDGAQEVARYEGLSHTYTTRTGPVCAVRGISLGVRKGECFGLLGPNGAGKTTTLAVLTGEVRPPTAGQVTVCGHSLASSEGLREAYQVLGVCPQVDPLWPTLSGREHLLFYGRVKGVPERALAQTVDTLLRRLGLDGADGAKQASKYSGGMKRKLSLGIALIGHSPVLFLDEPSAAVDAGAKRHLWKVIKRRGPDQTVVLTTHSMEEAEALCDRLAIQVKGQLRCLGTPNHIKRKYGSGYQLELFCNEAPGNLEAGPAAAVIQFVRDTLSARAELLEFHAGRYLFQLPPLGSELSLGKVFTELHRHKDTVGIVDYSVMQPSLEQVFLRFAREQEEPVADSQAVHEQTE
mmetsp:Transcript_29626/g.98150  ORF Transcript_29626/g.98150 Transcript_29626/m.98150 type:complete len:1380 (-) Transcript_29626:112-4251(-)